MEVPATIRYCQHTKIVPDETHASMSCSVRGGTVFLVGPNSDKDIVSENDYEQFE